MENKVSFSFIKSKKIEKIFLLLTMIIGVFYIYLTFKKTNYENKFANISSILSNRISFSNSLLNNLQNLKNTNQKFFENIRNEDLIPAESYDVEEKYMSQPDEIDIQYKIISNDIQNYINFLLNEGKGDYEIIQKLNKISDDKNKIFMDMDQFLKKYGGTAFTVIVKDNKKYVKPLDKKWRNEIYDKYKDFRKKINKLVGHKIIEVFDKLAENVIADLNSKNNSILYRLTQYKYIEDIVLILNLISIFFYGIYAYKNIK